MRPARPFPSFSVLKIRLAWRLARVLVHLLEGLATSALVFPLASNSLRERLTRAYAAMTPADATARGLRCERDVERTAKTPMEPPVE